VDATAVDAWETLLTQLKEDDGPPCYHPVEKYSTDVLGGFGRSAVMGIEALEREMIKEPKIIAHLHKAGDG
jgi:hypothetical protein